MSTHAAVRLLTNHASPAAAALRAGGEEIGVEVRTFPEFRDVEALRSWAPTGALVFMYGWPEAAERDVAFLRSMRVPVAVWQVDDPFYFRSKTLHDVTTRIARSADVYFSHVRELDEDYERLGVTVRHLPTCAKAQTEIAPMRLSPLSDAECERDVAFVGRLSLARRAFLDELRRHLPVGLNLRAFTDVSQVEACVIYRTTRVNLAFGTSAEIPGEGLTERTWDVPLVGGFLLQEQRAELAEHFDERELATFDSAEDCARKIVHYLGAPEARRGIAERARRRVDAEHRMAHRLAVVVEALEARSRRVLAGRTA